jgi:hypothetical protein
MSALYDKGREGFLDGSIDWDTDTTKCVLLNVSGTGTLYTVNLSTHQFLSDIASGARIGAIQTLTSKTVTAGVADAADPVFPLVSGSDNAEALAIWKDTGTESTSRLIAYIDGFTVLPNGGNITVVFDNGANKIFKL